MTSKNSRITFVSLLLICFLLLFGSACAPALPTDIKTPQEFEFYLRDANEALENSEVQLKRSEAYILESKKVLEESKRLLASMLELKAKNDAQVKKVQSERSAFERRRKQIELDKLKREEEDKSAKEQAAAAEPTRPPYSPSDAPL